jgi:hypothetical protein
MVENPVSFDEESGKAQFRVNLNIIVTPLFPGLQVKHAPVAAEQRVEALRQPDYTDKCLILSREPGAPHRIEAPHHRA